MFINYRIPSIIRSIEQRNFKVVPQDGRFDVSARDLYINRVKFHIIPEMTSHRLSVVKLEIKISHYF